MAQRAHELFDNIEIFRHTYWGSLDAGDIRPEIISNRNSFVEEYRIESSDRNRTVCLYSINGINGQFRRFFVHHEQYRTADGRYVLVVSPYTRNFDRYDSAVFTATSGFAEADPIYTVPDWEGNGGATTFVKVGTEREFADFMLLDE